MTIAPRICSANAPYPQVAQQALHEDPPQDLQRQRSTSTGDRDQSSIGKVAAGLAATLSCDSYYRLPARRNFIIRWGLLPVGRG